MMSVLMMSVLKKQVAAKQLYIEMAATARLARRRLKINKCPIHESKGRSHRFPSNVSSGRSPIRDAAEA
jgi:hypothetical protein